MKLVCSRSRGGRIHAILSPCLIAVVAAAVIFACTPSSRIVREASSPVQPEWINQLPHGGETLYFVGIKTAAETLEEGRDAALKDAMSKISNYLGSKVESVFEGHITEIEQRLRQQIQSKSAATVHGAKVVDSYYEKMTRVEKNFRMEKYDTYVLVSFSREAALTESNRQEKEKQRKVSTAYGYYIKGLNSEKSNRHYEARRFYKEALTIIEGIEDIIEINDDKIKNSEELRFGLKSHLQDVTSHLKRVSIFIKVNSSTIGAQTFHSSFASELAEQGFTVSDELPAIEITGEVSVTEGGYVINNHVLYAEGSVSAQRTSDRQVIAVYPFKVKGFHRTKEQAARAAIAEAGMEAGEGIAKMILAKEQ